MKKLFSLLLSVVLIISVIGINDVKAADYTSEALVFGVEYSQKMGGTYEEDFLGGRKYHFNQDTYKLIIPSAGILKISGYIDEYERDNALVSVGVRLGGSTIDECQIKTDTTSKQKYECEFKLDEGEYTVFVNNHYGGGLNFNTTEGILAYDARGCRYHITFSFDFNVTLETKISSLSKGKVKVTVPKGDKINGYEIRYKKSGDKKWTTETVETKKTLNKTFEGFSSGKKYTFQVRKYVLDKYGYTYYSNWTKQQKVKVK